MSTMAGGIKYVMTTTTMRLTPAPTPWTADTPEDLHYADLHQRIRDRDRRAEEALSDEARGVLADLQRATDRRILLGA